MFALISRYTQQTQTFVFSISTCGDDIAEKLREIGMETQDYFHAFLSASKTGGEY
jgi:DNA-binding ferritin-like protein